MRLPAALFVRRPAALAVILALLGISAVPSLAADKPDPGKAFARLSVTVRGRGGKGPALPTPFTILSDEKRAAVYVPESGGVLLLEGEQVRHHLPVPAVPADASSAIDDLDATDRVLVGGRWTPADEITVELFVFDLQSGKLLDHVESRNPRLGGEANETARFLWRVVVDGDTVGVYDPRLGASVPLWVRGTGILPGAEQMARMRAGIGFGRDPSWTPAADGSLSIRRSGRSAPVAGTDSLLFLDGGLEIAGKDGSFNPIVLMIDSPSRSTGSKSSTINLRAYLLTEPDAPTLTGIGVFGKPTADPVLALPASWFHGRPFRVRGRFVYWPYLGRDTIEIRRLDAEIFSLTDRSRP